MKYMFTYILWWYTMMLWQKDTIMFWKPEAMPSFQSIIIQYSASVHNSKLFIKLSNMEERKKLKFFVISNQINQKQLKWSDNGREKMAEHLCPITYLNDCFKWVAVTVQDIIPSVWLFIWSIRVTPGKWNYTLSGYKLDTTRV